MTTIEAENVALPELPAALRRAKIGALIVLVTAIVLAGAFLMFTERGQHISRNPKESGQEFQAWVAAHYAIAPVVFIATCVALCVLMLPVWWLQVLAGYGFGLLGGATWCAIGATVGAVASMQVSRWIGHDWFHRRVESRVQRLRELDEKLGHNGFLVVIGVRLLHFMPVGICNYALGLTTISTIDVALGTLLGSLPVITWWVAIGAGLHPWENWNLLKVIALMHVFLLAPIALRYWKPQWFKRCGIE